MKWLYVERLFSKGLTMAVLVIVMRELGPSQSAPLLAATSIVTLASSLVDQPFILYLLREVEDVQDRTDAALTYLWCWTLSVFAVSVALGFTIEALFHMQNLGIYTLVNALILFAFAGQVTPRVNLQNTFRLRTIATARMTALTASAVIGSAMWMYSKGGLTVITFYVLTEILVSLLLHKDRLSWSWRLPSGNLWQELRTFIFIFAWSNTLVWLSTQGSALASASFSSPADYAQLALALSSMRTVIDIISTPAQQALVPTLKKMRQDEQETEEYFSAFMTRLAGMCNFLVALVILGVPVATHLLLGPTWSTFPTIAMVTYCALPLVVHSTPDRMWLMMNRLEKLDLKLKNRVAVVDTALAIMFAWLGIGWATIGVSIRSFVMLLVRSRVTGRNLPTVSGKSPIVSAVPLAAIPFLYLGSTSVAYGIGLVLAVISGLQIWRFRVLANPAEAN